MLVNVRMLAFQPEEKVRPVDVPDMELTDADLLDAVFCHGQNAFCNDRAITSTTCSVSMGDVIELPDNAGNYLILTRGFHKLLEEEYEAYKATPRRDRMLVVMDISKDY